MLLYTEKQLRDYLVEARDHKLVEDKKGPNGEQLVFLMTHID